MQRRRYNRETLEVRFKGKSIADVLDMRVEEAVDFFAHIPKIHRRAQDPARRRPRLHQARPAGDHALGRRGPAGQARHRTAKVATGDTLYILDEPTTGLHFADVERLLDVLNRLVDAGNTVVVIEHNLDVIKSADWIIDLGPEGGEAGGEVVAAALRSRWRQKRAPTRASSCGAWSRSGPAFARSGGLDAGSRSPRRLAPVLSSDLIGVDVGGTKVAVATLHEGRLSKSVVQPTEASNSGELVDEIVSAVGSVRTAGRVGVGVGVPSVVEFATGRVRSSVNLHMDDLDLHGFSQSGSTCRYSSTTTRPWRRSAKPSMTPAAIVENLVMFTVGTRIGGGLVLGGSVYRGATGAAGELGHTLIGADLADGHRRPGTSRDAGSLESLAAGQGARTGLRRRSRSASPNRRSAGSSPSGGSTATTPSRRPRRATPRRSGRFAARRAARASGSRTPSTRSTRT